MRTEDIGLEQGFSILGGEAKVLLWCLIVRASYWSWRSDKLMWKRLEMLKLALCECNLCAVLRKQHGPVTNGDGPREYIAYT